MNTFNLVIFRRFARAFVAGGLVSLSAQLATSPQPLFGSPTDLKVWGISLFYAFFVGGVLALEKAARWTE